MGVPRGPIQQILVAIATLRTVAAGATLSIDTVAATPSR
jgi:hypothetical protein